MKRDYRFNAIDPDKYFVTSKDLDKDADYEAKPLPRLGEPFINNLAISRPALVACGQCGHRYSYKAPWCPSCGGVATEEAELLRTAQYREVVLRHIPWIRAQALKRWDTLNPRRNMGTSSAIASCGAIDLLPPKQERAIQFNDFVDACVEALWEAITRWRPSNNKLNAFARKFILGALSDIAADWRNKPGLQMDSRIQRFLCSHPYWAPKWIQERFPHYSIQRIEDEQQRAQGVWQQISSHAAWGYGWGPQPQWSRDAAFGYVWRAEGTEDRNALTWPINRRKRVRATIWDCRVEADFDERAIARLQRWGRNEYANWLVHHRKSTCKPYVVRDGGLIKIESEVPAAFESEVAAYYRGTHLAVAKIAVTMPRRLRPSIVGPGQARHSFWNERAPKWHTINLAPSVLDEPNIIPDQPIVEAVAVLEVDNDTETTAFETSERSRKPRSKMAGTGIAD